MARRSSSTGADPTSTELVALELGLLLRSLKALHHDVLDDVGVRLEMSAAALLGTVHDGGRMRPSAVADALHLDLSSVSRQVATLEREGWLERDRDPADSRACLVDLTASGREALQRVRAGKVAHLQRMLAEWSEDDLAAFAGQLHRLRTDVTRGRPEASRPDTPRADTTRAGHTSDPHHEQAPALAGQEI